jgi:hypothetical protein
MIHQNDNCIISLRGNLNVDSLKFGSGLTSNKCLVKNTIQNER